MRNNPLISVIVPVYNVEKYLSKCLDSIIAQTYQNLEIILVDDGSTDGSGLLCDMYSQQDTRIRVIHQPNAGLSAARNAGLEACQGSYIVFIDSDDYVANSLCSTLLSLCLESGSDIAMCGHYDVYFDRITPTIPKENHYLSQKEAIVDLYNGKYVNPSACRKLFKKEIFTDIRFPIGKLYEDAFIIVKLLLKIRKVAITTEQLYFYVRRENSITTCCFRQAHYDVIEAWKKNKELVLKVYPDLDQLTNIWVVWSQFSVLDKMILSRVCSTEQVSALVHELRSKLIFILRSSTLSTARKIGILALCLHVNFYKLLLTFYYKNNRKLG